MKILSAKQQKEADAFTINHEPVSSIDLMERASKAFVNSFVAEVKNNQSIAVFCGIGNNGGDGLAIARMLFEAGYKVKVFIIRFSDKTAADFNTNYQRLNTLNIPLVDVFHIQDLILENTDCIIDAIFGTGLSKAPKGLAAQAIQYINELNCPVFSVDIPSGLFSESNEQADYSSIIKATHTYTFQSPKLSFLFPENELYVGQWSVLDIGLIQNFINSLTCDKHLVKVDLIQSIYKKRSKFSHKGNFGHALLIAGSSGKMGAASLATKACMKSGTGLLTVHIPSHANAILQIAVPEAMLSLSSQDNYIVDIPKLSDYSCIGIGPGIGTHVDTIQALKQLIHSSEKPVVFDADALNILSLNKTWLSFLPQGSVLTPHPKEFERLFGKSKSAFDRMQLAINMAYKHQLVIVLKGAYTQIISPSGNCFFNTTGNSGMATAGSGDVLTGIITGLIAQGYTSLQASILGVYLHGMAGDLAANDLSQESLNATDLIHYLGKAYLQISSY